MAIKLIWVLFAKNLNFHLAILAIKPLKNLKKIIIKIPNKKVFILFPLKVEEGGFL